MNPTTIVDPLVNIMYISLPEDSERAIGEFRIDPEVLIPLEIVGEDESWAMQNLSWEMIVGAMLKVIVHAPQHEHRDYYRAFVLAAKPGIFADLMQSGVEQAGQQNFDAAEEIFRALTALDPKNPLAWINLALVNGEHALLYEKSDRRALADTYRERTFRLYAEMVETFPDEPQVYFNAGHFFLTVNNSKRAIFNFRRFLEIGTDVQKLEVVANTLKRFDEQETADQLFNEAYDFIRMGRELEAIERINAFMKVKPDVWNAWFLLGWAHRRLEQFESAKSAFLRAIELGSKEADALNELAICQMELGEYDASAISLGSALRLEPENVKIISNFGILEIKRERPAEAERYFRTVAELQPDDDIARGYLEFLAK